MSTGPLPPAVGVSTPPPAEESQPRDEGDANGRVLSQPLAPNPSGTPIHLDEGPEGILYLTFDDPDRRVNVFTLETLQRLEQLLDEIARTTDATAVIARSFKDDCFVAGADVESIARVTDRGEAMEMSQYGQRVFAKVETSRVPIVAAIDGVCLGGGTEFALACHFRLVSDRASTRIGLPEVKLGILPAWGGTQRLPKIVGLAKSLDLILSGRSLNGKRALRMGVADQLIPQELFADEVLRFTEKIVEQERGPRRARPKLKPVEKLLESNGFGRRLIFDKAADALFKTTQGHYPAPPKALEAVRIGIDRGNRAGYLLEATFVSELVVGPVCKNLVRLFFATETVKKSNGVDDPNVKPLRVERLGLLGAGIMGGGIAQVATNAGLPVRMKDLNHEAMSGALQQAGSVYRRRVRRRRMTKADMARKMALIAPTLDYSGFRRTDLVIEAIVENLEVKRQVFRELEDHVRDDCVVVSNTSSLGIGDMQTAFRHPERFAGMHFFNPVDRMPLVEVIRGPQTDPATVATVYALARSLGKTPVVVGDSPGFLVNRILMPYLNEACLLLEEGASVEQIDQVLVHFGMPMGPLRLLDEIGFDVARHAADVLMSAFAAHLRPSQLLGNLDDPQRLGRKTGLGFYRYPAGKGKKAEPTIDPAIYDIVRASRSEEAPAPGSVVMTDIHDRLLLPMINEAARCLMENVVETATQVDLGMVMGTGFPPFRGGILRYADTWGAGELVSRMQALVDAGHPQYEPCELLLDLARSKGQFHVD